MNFLMDFADLQTNTAAHQYECGAAFAELYKQGGVPAKTYSMTGRLYVSKSGWLLLSVPNSLVRGTFDSLNEAGIELPTNESGNLEAHISVMDAEEVEAIGGRDKISERGHFFKYNIGPIKTVEPTAWTEMSRVWYITIDSPDLRNLRRSYGLTPLRNGHDHHITVAVRRKNVLRENETSKVRAA